MGLLNILLQQPIKAPDEPCVVSGRECSKKFVQQGRSHFDERSVLIVRERERREERQVCEPEGSAKWRERRWRLFSTFPIWIYHWLSKSSVCVYEFDGFVSHEIIDY